MADSAKRPPITLQELMVSTLAMTDALAKLLIEKGIITDEGFKKEAGRGTSGVSGDTEGPLSNDCGPAYRREAYLVLTERQRLARACEFYRYGRRLQYGFLPPPLRDGMVIAAVAFTVVGVVRPAAILFLRSGGHYEE
jgi:hypothetical protein